MSGNLDVSNLCEAFQRSAAINPDGVALRTPGGAVEITWREYAERVRSIAAGLAALGVRRGHTVALMMTNRPEFNLCDTAVMHLGATAFSVYNTLAADQIAHLFSNAENRVVICEAGFAERVAAAGGKVEHIVCVDGQPAGTLSLEDVEATAEPGFDFDAAWRAVGPDDVLTLIYTSGTTGPPKGVEITHANMLAQIAGTSSVLPVTSTDRIASFLPSAHVADRWSSHYQQMVFGLQVTCVADIRTIAAALADIRPTLWGAVPRVWEKIKAALEARIDTEADPQRKQALQWAVATGLKKVRAEQAAINGEGPGPDDALLAEYAKADELVLSKVRQQLGLDGVHWSVSGAAPTSIDVLEFFAAIGLPICELWGMSELSCCATINPPHRIKLGTVGPAMPGVELAIADDGELLCRGPLLMRGYRNEPQKTAEAIDADGWLHTGDVATIDDEGYVRIVDRKKELIINAAGKNMSPANIESQLKSASVLIGQAVTIGDRRPYNVALIVLDPDACAAYAAKAGLPDASAAALCQHEGIVAVVSAAVEQANAGLSRVEQIKTFRILPVDWLPGGDELTPTMKLKRKPIAEKYAAEIEALYTGS
ncbi:MAG TPA: AMP-binding protein [Acidimicrobiia bacterium]|nr:AMP-binding protein [Acidimicrobiia bacterium]